MWKNKARGCHTGREREGGGVLLSFSVNPSVILMLKHLSRDNRDTGLGEENGALSDSATLSLVTLLHNNSVEMCCRVTLRAYLLPAASGKRERQWRLKQGRCGGVGVKPESPGVV